MGRDEFTIRNTERRETQYGGIGEIFYWGRHYIYKDYVGNCLFGINTVGEMGETIEKEAKFAPYLGINKRTGT